MEQTLKRQYYVSLVVIVFSLLVMVIAPTLVDNYFWPAMFVPIAIQAPVAFSARRALKALKEKCAPNAEGDLR